MNILFIFHEVFIVTMPFGNFVEIIYFPMLYLPLRIHLSVKSFYLLRGQYFVKLGVFILLFPDIFPECSTMKYWEFIWGEDGNLPFNEPL